MLLLRAEAFLFIIGILILGGWLRDRKVQIEVFDWYRCLQKQARDKSAKIMTPISPACFVAEYSSSSIILPRRSPAEDGRGGANLRWRGLSLMG